MQLIHGDCLEVLKTMPDSSVDLVLTSPPYEKARTYGIGFNLRGQQWVDWAVERYVECCRVSKGLVAWVVEGQTRQFQWSATPALLMADLHRAGVKLRKPPIYKRVGIPGSGGPDWLRNDYEFIVCASPGRLPWSDNTAMGHPPKWGVGGAMSNRTEDGRRRNAKTGSRLANGRVCDLIHTKTMANGEKKQQGYAAPAKANPGNFIDLGPDEEASEIVECHGGGGHMGSKLAHENEAPFPEKLAEFFVRSFCPPGGTVLDPFSGSGTTVVVAERLGRNGIGIDIRESQIELARRRVASVEQQQEQA